MLIGHQKGHTLKERQERSFGMTRPEGYRKAMRLARLAEKFGLPVVTLVDTPGAYPGKDAEEGGQAGAIARSIETFANLKVPTVTVVIGEGGSGGALALAVADRVLMLENSIYSVISPEGCASSGVARLGRGAPSRRGARVWRPPTCSSWVSIDAVIPEPAGGAHTDHAADGQAGHARGPAGVARTRPARPVERLRLSAREVSEDGQLHHSTQVGQPGPRPTLRRRAVARC